MADEKKKEPQTVADHVAGLARPPLDSAFASYAFPLLPGFGIGFLLGFASVVCYLIVAGFTGLFWMEGIARWMMDSERGEMFFLNLVRVCVMLWIAIYIFGVVLVALQRHRERLS